MQRLNNNRVPRDQRGIALITSLMLLLIITLLALSMFRSFGIQGRIAGNTREKERALHAAEAAQQYAEYWLQSVGSTYSPTVCNSSANNLLNANQGGGQICSNTLASVTTVPWNVGGAQVGVAYNPGFALNIQAAGTALGSYAQLPMFYIATLGLNATGSATIYQVDALGYGGNSNTVAVVESTYEVGSGVNNVSQNPSGY